MKDRTKRRAHPAATATAGAPTSRSSLAQRFAERRASRTAALVTSDKNALVMLDEIAEVMEPGTVQFYSDYFRTLDPYMNSHTEDAVWVYGSVLTLVPKPFAGEVLKRFWGVGILPPSGGPGTSAAVIHPQIRRPDSWVRTHISSAERATGMAKREVRNQRNQGSTEHKMATNRMSSDIDQVAAQIVQGASYHTAAWHVVLYAPTLAELDDYIRYTRAYYAERFTSLGLYVAPGTVRKRLSRLLDPTGFSAMLKTPKSRTSGSDVADAMADGGSRLGFTSVELAGSYSLVTGALTDVPELSDTLEPAPSLIVPVGTQVGDYSNGAVLIDPNKMESHAVIGSSHALHWTDLMSATHAACGSHVVHIVLDPATRTDVLGSAANLGDQVTTKLDLTRSTINLMEIFGPTGTELDAYPQHLDRFVRQMFWMIGPPASDASSVRTQLRDKLTTFYVDRGMWLHNAGENLERLRLLGLPHTQVPRLHDLMTYFASEYTRLSGTLARDDEALHAVSLLASGIRDITDTFGDVFDQHTSDRFDLPADALTTVYDIAGLAPRGWQVQATALASVLDQVIAHATVPGADPRTVIIHGAHRITAMEKAAATSGAPLGVADWVTSELEKIQDVGGRVIWAFDSVRHVLEAADEDGRTPVIDLVGADYTLLSGLSDTTLAQYAQIVDADPSPVLVKLSTGAGSDRVTVLKRGSSVVCFEPNGLR